MAAASYYDTHSITAQEQQQHLLSPALSSPGLSPGHSTQLKPLHLVPTNNALHQHGSAFGESNDVQQARINDARLKATIRRLRVISRTLAFFISIAVLVPITMTLVKFLHTQNTYRTIFTQSGPVSRTAWAKDTKAWPTYMYFSVAVVSVVLNFITIFSYRSGVEKANTASYVATGFSWFIMVGNLVVWIVAASLYRTEKDKGGKSNDLWGWTCSATARAIQKEFAGEVDFNTYCTVQSVSWYIGLVQVAAAVLTVVIYILVVMRMSSKKKLQQMQGSSGFAPAKH